MNIENTTEKSPEQLSVMKRLLEMYRTGIQEDGLIGYHGLSLQTIEYIIHHRVVPGWTYPDDPSSKGSLFFAAVTPDPYLKRIQQPEVSMVYEGFEEYPKYYLSPNEAFQQAERFAEVNATKRGLLSHLGLDQTNPENQALPYYLFVKTQDARRMERKEIRELLRQRNISNAQVIQALRQTRELRGLVFGVKKTIVDDFPIIMAHCFQDYGVINEPGFTLDYFTGLKCLGPEEEAFFQDLERKYGYLLE